MAVKTRAELKAENASDFPDNATRLISPADLRGQMDDIVDSALFPEDGLGGIPGPPGPAGPPGETGITASSVHYTNVAAVAGVSIGVGVNLIETLSYATPADGAGGIYRRVAGPADIQSGDGAWWELVPVGPLRVAALGVIGGAGVSGSGVWSGTDVEPQIKDGLYKHVYGLKGSAVELPIGNLLLGRGIHLGYGDTFRGGRLRGSGIGYNFQNYPTTTLVWNFTDEPALSIQGGRNMRVNDIAFSGPGLDYILDNALGTIPYAGAADDTLLATWIDPAWPAQASSRYAPAAAIAIDPRRAPADPTYHYRDVDYPAAMGAISQYDKGISSGITIEDFDFYGGGMCAVVVQPNKDSDGNGDFVRLKSGRISSIPIGISIGQTQARLTSCDGVDFAVCHTAITTNTHGKQDGAFTEAWNCHFGGIQIFNIGDTSISGHITINGYGEEMWRIGTVQLSTAAALKLVLHNLKLSFELQSDSAGNRGVPATMISGNSGVLPLEINGGSWGNYYGAAYIDVEIRAVSILGLVLQPRDPTTLPEKCAMNGLAGGLVFPHLGFASLQPGEIHPKFMRWNLDTGAEHSAEILGRRYSSSRVVCTPLWVERHGSSVAREEGVFIPNRVYSIDIATFWGSATLVNLVLTVTWPGSWTAQQFMTLGPLPGDVMLHDASRSVFVCMTRVGTTVTFKLVNNYRGLSPRNTINLTSGQAWLACMRWYSPLQPVYGIITSGSAVITDAGNVPHGGGVQDGTQLDPHIAVGDYLIVDPSLAPYLNQALCNVTAIDETAKTITLGGAGAAIGSSTTRVRLGTFVRPGIS